MSPTEKPTPRFRANEFRRDLRQATYEGQGLIASFTPEPHYPFTMFSIRRHDGQGFSEKMTRSHYGLARLLTGFDFHRVLDIGSRHGTSARAMEFAGKDVSTCEIMESYQAEASGDYLELEVAEPFDAIWCSHVLEHQRYAGQFIDKMFADLKEGGILALTVPSALSPVLHGHINIYTPGVLLYNLICAGFDCSNAEVKTYDQQFTVIVRKRSNGIPRISFGSEKRLGTKLGGVPNLNELFPEPFCSNFTKNGHAWGEVEETNWGRQK